jgi:uncharacterized protein (TIGR03437 family)
MTVNTKILLCLLIVATGIRAQIPTISAVVNGASYSPAVSPGAVVAIFGADFGSAPMETSVTVGGLPATVLFSSRIQINVQLPFELSVGSTTLTVKVQGRTSAAVSITVSEEAPAMFVDHRQRVGIFEGAAGLVTAANPASPGDTIIAYLTGLGATKPAVTLPSITIGGAEAPVLLAGPVPDSPGVYQVKFVVPRVGAGRQDAVVSMGGMSSPAVAIPIGFRRAATAPIVSRGVQLPNPEFESVAAPNAKVVLRPYSRDISPRVSQPAPAAAGHGTVAYTCDSSINAVSGVCNTLNTTIAGLYASAFTNVNASIYITFGNTGLGSSLTELNLINYSSYRSALVASESNTNDVTAVTNSVPTTNPFGSDVVAVTNANARALGFLAAPGLTGDDNSCCYDGIITVSSSFESSGGLYFRNGSIGSGQYDFYTVVEHETDEVLGTASCAFGCTFGSTVAFSPADLFRYHSNGTRSFAPGTNHTCSTSSSTNACFSIDGINMLQAYNNLNNGEDAGDWAPNCASPHVQDSESCPGVANLDIAPTKEIEVLDVVGFTLPGCTYSLASSSVSVGASAGSGSVGVVAGGGCAWTASSNAGWLTINSGSSGSGNGTVSYSFTANSGSTGRSAILTIAGLSFNVMQAANSSLEFYALAPCRIADTRSTGGSGLSGAFGPPFMGGGSTRNFPIQSSGCNVPPAAQAYSLNITIVPHATLGFLTAWPSGTTLPLAATVNSLDGRIVGNAAIVAAGTAGAISLYASDDTDVVVDINGYFGAPNAPQALAFYPVTPCRVADTRSGRGFSGAFGAPSLAGGATRDFPLQQSVCGIPVTAQAYSVRMTVVAPGPLGYLTTWPSGQARPKVATLNALNGGVVGNEAIVAAGTGGAISIYASDNTDLVMDVNGYFAPPGSPGALYFYTLTSCRVADTRSGKGFSGAFGTPSLAAGATRDFPMPSSSCGIPSSAQAYLLNMTVVASNSLGYLTAWPSGQVRPTAATVNALNGGVVGSAAIVPAGTSGAMSVYASDNTDLIIDTSGYFGP